MHEAAGTIESDEYQAAAREYYERHVRRLDPAPEALQRARAGTNGAVYNFMWGPNEFTVTGTLAEYDRTNRLPEIRLPTLFTCGRYDEATPEATAWYQRLIRGSEMTVFEQSAHLPHLGESERYVQTVRSFLRRVEG
jgi:proline iminopeptidase